MISFPNAFHDAREDLRKLQTKSTILPMIYLFSCVLVAGPCVFLVEFRRIGAKFVRFWGNFVGLGRNLCVLLPGSRAFAGFVGAFLKFLARFWCVFRAACVSVAFGLRFPAFGNARKTPQKRAEISSEIVRILLCFLDFSAFFLGIFGNFSWISGIFFGFPEHFSWLERFLSCVNGVCGRHLEPFSDGPM